MTDDLRGALTKLCVELEEYDDSITAVTLRALLAKHPAPPLRPEVDRQTLAMLLADTVQTLDKDEEWYIADRVIALTRLPDPRPTLDRDVLAALLLFEEGSEWTEGTNRHYELADAILALSRAEEGQLRSSSTS